MELFGPKTEEVTGGWRKFYNAEHHSLYSSDIFTFIKSGRKRWAGHV
jgi:hypothetical protein